MTPVHRYKNNSAIAADRSDVAEALLQEGGERRLNVLFTRARSRCEIFCSFASGDIDPDRAKGEGARWFAAGNGDPGGKLPMNTNGGLLSAGHTGVGGGTALLVEANVRDEFCPLAPLAGVEALPPEARGEIVDRVRGLEHGYPDVARDGLADGTVRDVELTGVALAMAGAFGWLHKWFAPELVSPQVVVAEQVRLLAAGLAAR